MANRKENDDSTSHSLGTLVSQNEIVVTGNDESITFSCVSVSRFVKFAYKIY